MTEKSDVQLVREFRSGDAEAFDVIVARFQDRVFRLCRVWLHDGQNADDAAQEVFLRAWRGLRRFRFRSEPFTWLYRTTRNVCNELNRRRRLEALAGDPEDSAASPERDAEQSDVASRVRSLVAALPERQREVVLLRLFEDLSVRETAAAMGCREGTVKALLHKATKRLRLNIDETGLIL